MSPPPSKPRPPLPEGPFLVVGLARSGAAAAKLLAERGHEVRGIDAGHPDEAEGLRRAGVEVSLDDDGMGHLEGVRAVVKSPGVPREAAVIAAATERGLPVIGELELGWRLLPNRFIAVTGTNGKTTTTELIGNLYRKAGEPVAVAGNVGNALASLVGDVGEDATVVCECSSFQLEDTEAFAPECAVLLNLAPDHLDRHRDLAAYLAAKLRIFANQANEDVAVYNGETGALEGVDLGGCARRLRFCAGIDPDCEVSLAEGTIFWAGEPLLDTSELSLLGAHNVRNAMAAAAAALSMGIEREAVRDGLRSFAGVPHRLEPILSCGGIEFVNDSKATNVAAAIAAIRSFEHGVHVILGGRGKGEDFAPLAEAVERHCTGCYLIGESAAGLERALAGTAVPLQRCDGLEDAVTAARQSARPGEVVLLSPACASFDSYVDFEQRGEHFRELVARIAAGERR